MSYYRHEYLKSDEWKSLRKAKIIQDGFRCKLCEKRPTRKSKTKFGSGFQVHHLQYKNLHNVELGDLRTLCTPCHKKVHLLMEKYPKMKTLPRARQWNTVLYHLNPEKRPSLAGMIKGVGPAAKKERSKSPSEVVFESFCVLKNELFSAGLICKNRMKWRDSFYSTPKICESISSKESLLSAYIDVTLQDPRRLIPAIYKPLPTSDAAFGLWRAS